ncbi:hypothetical protein [uncultured Tateyamaria sp.]|uniref:hypothetical protein n=1 Tax=Tateyamaria sp. 1078 TaxID=3417464 RepID=UPI00261CA931|nr:hypothetical protein [uncultured Tateyamaria sp.]
MNGSRFEPLALLRALFACVALLALPVTASSEETAVTTSHFQHTYSANVITDNAFFQLSVNGAPMAQHLRLENQVLTVPVEMALQHGPNSLVLDVEPFDLDAQAFTPHAGVYIQIGLTQLRGAPVGQSVLLTLRYDVGEGRFVQVDDGANAQSFAPTSAIRIEETQIVYGNRVSDAAARRITVSFDLNDPALTQVPWADAIPLADTPENRTVLYEASAALHSAYAEGDVEAWSTILGPHLERLRRARGYDTIPELVSAVLDRSPLSGPDGAQLMPLLSPQEAASVPLRSGPDDRLVTFRQAPIRFMVPDAQRPRTVRVYFCALPAGVFVCHTQQLTF